MTLKQLTKIWLTFTKARHRAHSASWDISRLELSESDIQRLKEARQHLWEADYKTREVVKAHLGRLFMESLK